MIVGETVGEIIWTCALPHLSGIPHLPAILGKFSWDTPFYTRIPTKRYAPCPPLLIFFASDMQQQQQQQQQQQHHQQKKLYLHDHKGIAVLQKLLV